MIWSENSFICRMPRARRAFFLASLTSAALLSTSAVAQTIDYGSLEQLFGEPVTASATGTPQRATEAPANMEIVTAEEIRRSGAYDIPGVLRHVLGVDVLQWFNDNADVGLRGYNQAFSPRVLVLIDGRQVYADHYGYTPWSALPVELGAIRQIEIVKGPNTALFGFNAVSGVINIITYNLLYDDVNTASVGGGTQGLAQGSIVKTLRFKDRAALRLTAGGRVDDDFSTPVPPSLGELTQAPNHRFAFDLDGGVRLSDAVQLTVEATHSGSATNDMDGAYSFSHIQHFTSSLKGQLTADTGLGLIQGTIW
jgi:iron complex outermembrane receptor protein